MTDLKNIARGMTQPVSDHLAIAQKRIGSAEADGKLKVSRMYIGSNNTLQRSSNFLSHAIRAIMGKVQGAEALRQAMIAEYGLDPFHDLNRNLPKTYGELNSSMGYFKSAYGEPEVEDFDVNDDVQSRAWQVMKAKSMPETQVGNLDDPEDVVQSEIWNSQINQWETRDGANVKPKDEIASPKTGNPSVD